MLPHEDTLPIRRYRSSARFVANPGRTSCVQYKVKQEGKSASPTLHSADIEDDAQHLRMNSWMIDWLEYNECK